MIVISGALVVVAFVLLLIGLIGKTLPFVYSSIGVSVLSFAFLIVGILQRRKVGYPDEAAVAEATVPMAPALGALEPELAIVSAPAAAAAPVAVGAGQVLVVEGRPRYHVAGCRYLVGKTADSVDVAEARDKGFTACGVCKPDAALTAAPEPVLEAPVLDEVEAEEPVVAAPVRKAAPARARATAPVKKAVVAKAPAKKAVAAKAAAPVKKAAVAAAAPVKAPVKKAAVAAKAPAKKAAAAKAPAKAAVAAKAPAKKAPAKKAPAKKAPVKKAAR